MVFTNSLKGRYVFKNVLRKGKYSHEDNITVYFLKNNKNVDKNFLGICVSKKHGNSVVRNRLKRWAREAYKEIEKKIKPGFNIIILFKKNINIDGVNFHVIKKELLNCIRDQEISLNEENN